MPEPRQRITGAEDGDGGGRHDGGEAMDKALSLGCLLDASHSRVEPFCSRFPSSGRAQIARSMASRTRWAPPHPRPSSDVSAPPRLDRWCAGRLPASKPLSRRRAVSRRSCFGSEGREVFQVQPRKCWVGKGREWSTSRSIASFNQSELRSACRRMRLTPCLLLELRQSERQTMPEHVLQPGCSLQPGKLLLAATCHPGR